MKRYETTHEGTTYILLERDKRLPEAIKIFIATLALTIGLFAISVWVTYSQFSNFPGGF